MQLNLVVHNIVDFKGHDKQILSRVFPPQSQCVVGIQFFYVPITTKVFFM